MYGSTSHNVKENGEVIMIAIAAAEALGVDVIEAKSSLQKLREEEAKRVKAHSMPGPIVGPRLSLPPARLLKSKYRNLARARNGKQP